MAGIPKLIILSEQFRGRTFELTKRYFAFGHFSKFIENGSVRFKVDAGGRLDAVGFRKAEKMVVVIANRNESEETIELPEGVSSIYLTNETHSLDPVEITKNLALPPKSICTLIIR